MNWLFEDSTTVLTVTVLAEIVLIVSLLRSGNGRLLYAALIVAVLGGGCVVIEWYVETEREQIEQVVEQTRRAVLTNNPEKVFHWIAADSPVLRGQAKRHLAHFEIEGAKITDGPRITMQRTVVPPVSSVEFNARLNLKSKAGTLSHSTALVRVEARLKKTPDGWRWTEATFSSPLSR